jgi:spore coat polysaccharide biosynthesis protein SpsF (cytidylyltransferase family)/aryl-alcohol dehydrogenase-like predicted oxidoreductase
LKVVIIIQGRMASTRLPAKALLPIAGYPSAILAALRASNRQHQTIFATSDDPSDDVLAREAHKHGLAIFRGPLEDVLRRYCLAVAGFSDDYIVIRLTADNVVPDGQFVEEMSQAFVSAGAEYLGMDSVLSRMPYGIAGEAFTVAALRRANKNATSRHDREHVGPWMKRNCRSGIFIPQFGNHEPFKHLRCTIDDQCDYDRMLRLFQGIIDPLEIGWRKLAQKLAAMPPEPFRRPNCRVAGALHSQLTLGTAQLGLKYGAVNDTGKPSKVEAVAIVRHAIEHGVAALDTARCYGDSEAILGEALTRTWRSRVNVVSKLDLLGLSEGASEADARRVVDGSIDSSCRALGTVRLDTLLLHRWDHRHLWHGAAWQRLVELQEQDKIGVLGASVYETEEALDALQDPGIGHLQIPINVLDWRWQDAGVDQAIRQRPDVIVHGRSAFLQGILVHSSDRWPVVGNLDSTEYARKLLMLMETFGRDSLADLCIAYVRALPWISSIVVGCETLHQLEQNLKLFLRPSLSSEQAMELECTMPKAPRELLNPAKWNVPCESHAAYAS